MDDPQVSPEDLDKAVAAIRNQDLPTDDAAEAPPVGANDAQPPSGTAQMVAEMSDAVFNPVPEGATTMAKDVLYSSVDIKADTAVQATSPELGSAAVATRDKPWDGAAAGGDDWRAKQLRGIEPVIPSRLPGNIFSDEEDVLDAVGERVVYQLDAATVRAATLVAADLAGVAVLNVHVDQHADYKKLAPSQQGYPVVQVRDVKHENYPPDGAAAHTAGTWRWP